MKTTKNTSAPASIADLVGDSHDVRYYKSYFAYCTRLGIAPASFEDIWRNRQAELTSLEKSLSRQEGSTDVVMQVITG